MNPDDPKFTAHILGEVDDLTPSERAEIEALLASDPSAQAEAEEMRALAARLRAELPGEAAGALREEQRAAVLTAATDPRPVEKIVRFPRRATVLALIAACLVVGVSVALLFPALQAEKAAVRKSLATAPEPSFDTARELAIALPAPPPPGQEPPAQFAQTSPVAPGMPATPSVPVVPTGPLLAGSSTGGGSIPVIPAVSYDPRTGDPASVKADASLAMNAEQAPASRATAGSSRGNKSALGKDARTADSQLKLELEEKIAMVAEFKAMPATTPAPAMPAASIASRTVGLAFEEEKPLRFETGDGGKSRYPFLGLAGDQVEQSSAESFAMLADNAFQRVQELPLSTFSIDVDTASYSIVRRFLNNNQQPPKGAVRIEELLNYFTYDYPQPKGDAPFSAAMEVAGCPWTPEHRLVRIGLKGREIAKDQRPASNLVFLIDVSGSMRPDNKLPLLRQSLGMFIDQLGDEDQVAIVVYAGNSGCVLDPTRDKRKMHAALSRLEAGGSTNGGSGLQLAYRLAEQGFIKGGTNRVILATDGDWNVGITNQSALLGLIKQKARSGVFLTVLGVGMDNLKDSMLVKLADTGNGNYAYLDTVLEARKVLVEQLSGTLVTIAKDVKIQVEFNPSEVGSYRLIGYEKRLLRKQDFNDDKKDAGEIGAGHTVTALYEVVPVGQPVAAAPAGVDPLKYQPATTPARIDPDPAAKSAGDAFVSAYMTFQRGEKAEQAGELDRALAKYKEAAQVLEKIRLEWPTWQPEILVYRKTRTATAITRVEQKLERLRTTPPVPETEPAKPEPGKVPPALIPPDSNLAIITQERAEAERAGAARIPTPAVVKTTPAAAASEEMLTLKLRYKEPEGDTSKLLEFPLIDLGTPWEKSSRDFRFAAAVAGYGMLLRDSAYKGEATWDAVAEWAQEGKGNDPAGYRAEFLSLIDKARALSQ